MLLLGYCRSQIFRHRANGSRCLKGTLLTERFGYVDMRGMFSVNILKFLVMFSVNFTSIFFCETFQNSVHFPLFVPLLFYLTSVRCTIMK